MTRERDAAARRSEGRPGGRHSAAPMPASLSAGSSEAGIHQLVDHFFRHQAGRLTALLTRSFGVRNIDLVEDVVQSALLSALEAWKIRGAPRDPGAWLYRAARNRALDVLRHRRVIAQSTPELSRRLVAAESQIVPEFYLDTEVADSQLRMMFACCDPQLAAASRVALTLKILCGFGVAEIARALLTTPENAKRRLTRAKAQLAAAEDEFAVPAGAALTARLVSVHVVLYLLFNEGYSSTHSDLVIRRDLCDEAIRLAGLLVEHSICGTPASKALLALMLFQTARFDGRLDRQGSILLLEEQDRTLWDRELISRATQLIGEAAQGDVISRYHLEARIAAYHATAPSFATTDWEGILSVYDLLVAHYPSPVYELNRAIALLRVEGAAAAIAVVERLQRLKLLEHYYLVDATLGQLYAEVGDRARARRSLETARDKTASESEQRLLERKITELR